MTCCWIIGFVAILHYSVSEWCCNVRNVGFVISQVVFAREHSSIIYPFTGCMNNAFKAVLIEIFWRGRLTYSNGSRALHHKRT